MAIQKIACPEPGCGQMIAPWALPLHKATKHMPAKLEAATAKITQLEVELSDVKKAGPKEPLPAPAENAELSDETRLAILGDWIEGLTKEAWVEIGNQRGFWDEKPVAEMSDAKTDEKPAVAEKKSTDEPAAQLADAIPLKVKVKKVIYLSDIGVAVESVSEAK